MSTISRRVLNATQSDYPPSDSFPNTALQFLIHYRSFCLPRSIALSFLYRLDEMQIIEKCLLFLRNAFFHYFGIHLPSHYLVLPPISVPFPRIISHPLANSSSPKCWFRCCAWFPSNMTPRFNSLLSWALPRSVFLYFLQFSFIEYRLFDCILSSAEMKMALNCRIPGNLTIYCMHPSNFYMIIFYWRSDTSCMG